MSPGSTDADGGGGGGKCGRRSFPFGSATDSDGGDAKRTRFAATAPRASDRDAAHFFEYDRHSPATEPPPAGHRGRGGDHAGAHGTSTGGGGGPLEFGDGSSSEFMGLDSCDRPALNPVDRAYLRKVHPSPEPRTTNPKP
jgi:hypothetical protein